MLKFDVALCSTRDNVAHLSASWMRQAGKVLFNVADELPSNVADKLPRYRFHLFVASELVSDVKELASDVERFIPDKAHVASTNMRLRRISGFLPAASCGVSSGGLL